MRVQARPSAIFRNLRRHCDIEWFANPHNRPSAGETSDGDFGSWLGALEALIEQHGIGEFGGGQAALYCNRPDANRVFATIENEVRSLAARPTYGTLRARRGRDSAAQERQVDV
jgi:hypothetical protein